MDYWNKESICIKIEFKSQGISLVHHHVRHSFALEHQHGGRDVIWKRSIEKEKMMVCNFMIENLAQVVQSMDSATQNKKAWSSGWVPWRTLELSIR